MTHLPANLALDRDKRAESRKEKEEETNRKNVRMCIKKRNQNKQIE